MPGQTQLKAFSLGNHGFITDPAQRRAVGMETHHVQAQVWVLAPSKTFAAQMSTRRCAQIRPGDSAIHLNDAPAIEALRLHAAGHPNVYIHRLDGNTGAPVVQVAEDRTPTVIGHLARIPGTYSHTVEFLPEHAPPAQPQPPRYRVATVRTPRRTEPTVTEPRVKAPMRYELTPDRDRPGSGYMDLSMEREGSVHASVVSVSVADLLALAEFINACMGKKGQQAVTPAAPHAALEAVRAEFRAKLAEQDERISAIVDRLDSHGITPVY